MRPPDFWSAEPAARAPMLQALLWPLSLVYDAAGAQRIKSARPVSVAAPVICIGNLTLGGAGKTPITRAIRARLGADAHVLLRGYGGKKSGVRRVTTQSPVSDVGDEALLHALDGPTWVSADRVAGARAAIEAGARIVLMDDGFQNPTLKKDLSIVVIDAAARFGNGRVFPAGPLRERVALGLARADAVVVLANGDEAGGAPEELQGFARPILHAAIRPVAPPPAQPLVAFAGIARPDKFFDTLKAQGADVTEAVGYADHHPFTETELAWLARLAEERSATLITTEKDAARLTPAWRARVAVLKIAADFAASADLDALLAPIAARQRAGA